MFTSDARRGINNYPVGILFTGSSPLSNQISARRGPSLPPPTSPGLKSLEKTRCEIKKKINKKKTSLGAPI